MLDQLNYGRFAYESFRLPPVRLRLESIRLSLVCQFAYVLNNYCIKRRNRVIRN